MKKEKSLLKCYELAGLDRSSIHGIHRQGMDKIFGLIAEISARSESSLEEFQKDLKTIAGYLFNDEWSQL